MITLGSSRFSTLDTFYFTGYANLEHTQVQEWEIPSADYILVDSCLDICSLATLDRHDGPWLGVDEHATGSHYKFRRNNGTAFSCRSIRGWIRACCGTLYDIFLPPRRNGPTIWTLHLLLTTCQLLCFSPCIRSCSCQNINP